MTLQSQKPLAEEALEIDFPSKAPIKCLLTGEKTAKEIALIFTHGSGGTLKAAAMVNFVHGFTQIAPILCFQGNMNLPSRTKMFSTVCKDRNYWNAIGGRSMGARAAVLAATDQTTRLVLVSYPLHTDKQVRDQILLDLPSEQKVLFVSGDQDSMCNLDRLRELRTRMVCKTWMVTVQGTDHGMNVKPKAGTESVGMKIGEVVARWLGSCDGTQTEGSIFWDAETGSASWSGWKEPATHQFASNEERQVSEQADDLRQGSLRKPSKKRKVIDKTDSVNGDVSKRRKK